jgi:hypothetical protein
VAAVAGPGLEREPVQVRAPGSSLNSHNHWRATRAYTGQAPAIFFSAFGGLLRVLLRLRVYQSNAVRFAARLDMIWLILEGILALALFVFIIWWTLPRKPGRDKKKD